MEVTHAGSVSESLFVLSRLVTLPLEKSAVGTEWMVFVERHEIRQLLVAVHHQRASALERRILQTNPRSRETLISE